MNMTNYNGFNIRQSIAAGICAVLLTITTIVAVAAPMAKAQDTVRTAQIIVPLA
jgi:hypothetical protein